MKHPSAQGGIGLALAATLASISVLRLARLHSELVFDADALDADEFLRGGLNWQVAVFESVGELFDTMQTHRAIVEEFEWDSPVIGSEGKETDISRRRIAHVRPVSSPPIIVSTARADLGQASSTSRYFELCRSVRRILVTEQQLLELV